MASGGEKAGALLVRLARFVRRSALAVAPSPETDRAQHAVGQFHNEGAEFEKAAKQFHGLWMQAGRAARGAWRHAAILPDPMVRSAPPRRGSSAARPANDRLHP